MQQEDEQLDDRNMSYDCWELRQIIYDKNTPLEERDNAIEELKQIADQGDPHAQYLVGLLYRDGGLLVPDTEQVKHWLELSAQELPDAQYALGKSYTSRMILTCTTPQRVFTGCNGQRTEVTNTLPTAWEKSI